jgi:hypothetical protein
VTLYTPDKSTRKFERLWGCFQDQNIRLIETADLRRVKLTLSNPAKSGTEDVFDASISLSDGAMIISNRDKRKDTGLEGSKQDISLPK